MKLFKKDKKKEMPLDEWTSRLRSLLDATAILESKERALCSGNTAVWALVHHAKIKLDRELGDLLRGRA